MLPERPSVVPLLEVPSPTPGACGAPGIGMIDRLGLVALLPPGLTAPIDPRELGGEPAARTPGLLAGRAAWVPLCCWAGAPWGERAMAVPAGRGWGLPAGLGIADEDAEAVAPDLVMHSPRLGGGLAAGREEFTTAMPPGRGAAAGGPWKAVAAGAAPAPLPPNRAAAVGLATGRAVEATAAAEAPPGTPGMACSTAAPRTVVPWLTAGAGRIRGLTEDRILPPQEAF